MGMPPLLIQLHAAERKELERLAHKPSTPQQLAQRMRIVMLAADGLNNVQISQQLGVSTKMVRYWRRRWKESAGDQPPPLMDRLSDRERPGAPMKFSLTQQVDVLAMACRRPEDYGIESSQWTARMLRDQAVEEGIIESISVRHIRRWLNEADLKPHQIRYWLFPPLDPEFEEKSIEICNCYLSAMEGATQGVRTICIDEKSGIQALERAQDSPMKPGQAERKEFEYLRHGTQTLIANFDVATGKIIKPTIGMHRKEDDFLRHCQQLVASDPNAEKWCIVLDGLNIHKSESLVRWVAEMEGISDEELGTKGQTGILKSMKSRAKFLSKRSHRIVFYYTPKHCSWLNQVEIWFSILSRRLLRRASFSSIGNLAERIMRFIAQYNLAAKPFKWTFKGKLLHT